MRSYALIVNNGAGAASAWKENEEQILSLVPCTVYELDTVSVDQALLDITKKGTEVVIAMGGDGTLSSVVDAIMRINPELLFAIIPAGTLNHFAKDLGIPLTIPEAVQAITEGHTAHIDVAQVNERYFINNSSVGLYPLLVLEREKLQKNGHTKWVALFIAGIKMLRSFRPVHIQISKGNTNTDRKVTGLFIGNNTYQFEGMQLGSRKRLDESVLTLANIQVTSYFGIIKIIINALRGKTLSDSQISTVGVTSCQVRGHGKRILVSYDGEITHMNNPLMYSIHPHALRVICPAIPTKG
jgi:YegS/Rv2252/BmrU family lipid kinase